jgi:class 3 adenylate cyclase
MMMLSAIILLVGFVALAGMVARVNQLGTQTTTESRKGVLTEVGPVQDALDALVSSLAKRTCQATNTPACTPTTTASSATVTTSIATFAPSDIGLNVTGAGIAAGTTIIAVASATSATMSAAATGATTALTLQRAYLGYDTTTSPTLDAALAAGLAQLKREEAGHGLTMGYVICGNAAHAVAQLTSACSGTTQCYAAQVVVHLGDGDVAFEIASSVKLPRVAPATGAGSCSDVTDGFFPLCRTTARPCTG